MNQQYPQQPQQPPHPWEQQPPIVGPAQQQWGAPPPQWQPQPRKNRAGLAIGLGCGGAFLLTAMAGVVIIATSDSSDPKPKPAAAPPYRIVQQDDSGNARDVVVEVDSTKRLDDVFTAVADTLTDPAGYIVQINCSTGGTKSVDNRLGNGRVAVGREGAAATGLDDGAREFETNPGRKCPA